MLFIYLHLGCVAGVPVCVLIMLILVVVWSREVRVVFGLKLDRVSGASCLVSSACMSRVPLCGVCGICMGVFFGCVDVVVNSGFSVPVEVILERCS